MYTSFFGLREKPFSITPDPRYLFMSERHAEALAHLLYGINEAGGFVQLTGEIGAGKTTLVRSIVDKLPGHADVAIILNPQLTPHELLLKICEEIGMQIPAERATKGKDVIDLLNAHLLAAHAQGRRVIVIIDEAQTLNAATLEQIRLLTNLETATAKLLQIILIGQPELRDVLAHSSLKQLAQRITGRYHLAPLSRRDTAAYVRHRLRVAGANSQIFTERALLEIHRVTGGVPRLINVVCDRALLGAYTQDRLSVDVRMVRQAASEVFAKQIYPRWIVWSGVGATTAALGLLAFGVWRLWTPSQDEIVAAAVPVVTQSVPVIEPTAAPPSIPDIDPLLTHADGQTTTAAAFSGLFTLWGAKFDGTAPACEQARAQGLECVYQKGSWGQLRVLNRPAILTLTDDAGAVHQVVVARLERDSAYIVLAGEQKQVSLNSLSRLWLGDYLLMWRPQVPGQRAMAVGMRGNEVRWLRKSLAHVHPGEMAGETLANDVYDEELAKQVEAFQRQYRLTIDGIAGLQTQIVLDSAVDTSNAPRLLTETTDHEQISG